MVVAVHTSFCRIYTQNTIAYSRTQTGLNRPPRRPSDRRRAHTFECLVALVCVDSGFIGAVSWPDSEPSAKDLRVCNPQGKAAPRGRFPDSSTTPALLVSLPHWSIPKPLTTSLLKHCTPHSSQRSSPNCLAQLQCLATNFSSSNRVLATKSNPSTFRICQEIIVTVRTRPLFDPGDNCFGAEKPLIPTFLWNLCERSFYIALNRIK